MTNKTTRMSSACRFLAEIRKTVRYGQFQDKTLDRVDQLAFRAQDALGC